jgi:hypothetical protein
MFGSLVAVCLLCFLSVVYARHLAAVFKRISLYLNVVADSGDHALGRRTGDARTPSYLQKGMQGYTNADLVMAINALGHDFAPYAVAVSEDGELSTAYLQHLGDNEVRLLFGLVPKAHRAKLDAVFRVARNGGKMGPLLSNPMGEDTSITSTLNLSDDEGRAVDEDNTSARPAAEGAVDHAELFISKRANVEDVVEKRPDGAAICVDETHVDAHNELQLEVDADRGMEAIYDDDANVNAQDELSEKASIYDDDAHVDFDVDAQDIFEQEVDRDNGGDATGEGKNETALFEDDDEELFLDVDTDDESMAPNRTDTDTGMCLLRGLWHHTRFFSYYLMSNNPIFRPQVYLQVREEKSVRRRRKIVTAPHL